MQVRLQYRFLFKLLAVVAVMAMLLGGVHRWQIYRNSSQVLAQARAAVEAGKQVKAARLYSQYLGLSRNSAEAHFELAQILAKQGNLNKAFLYLEGAIRIDPSHDKARELLVKVSMDLERHADAKAILTKNLIPKDPKNAEYPWLLGLCESRLGEFDASLENFTLSVNLDKQNPIYAASLAELLGERMKRTTEALAVLDSLVTQAAGDPEAFLARGRWLLNQSRGGAGLDNNFLETAWSGT